MRQEAGTSDDGIVELLMSQQYIGLSSGIKDEVNATRVLVEQHVKDEAIAIVQNLKTKNLRGHSSLRKSSHLVTLWRWRLEKIRSVVWRNSSRVLTALWALYPVLMRVGQDVPSHSDLHWQPPKANDDGRHASDLNEHYDQQSQTLLCCSKRSTTLTDVCPT